MTTNRQQADLSYSYVNVAQANIETGHDRHYVIPDMRKAKEDSNVVTLNEMYTPKYHAFLRFVFRPNKWGCYPKLAADPILWRKCDFKVRDKKSVLLHKGIKGILSSRKLRAVLLEDKVTHVKFWVTNKHYVSKAWNGKLDSQEKLRKVRWEQGLDNEIDFITSLNRNYPIISNGDYNRIKWSPSFYFPVHDEGLSKIFTAPLSNVDLIGKKRIRGNSNHPILKTVLRLNN